MAEDAASPATAARITKERHMSTILSNNTDNSQLVGDLSYTTPALPRAVPLSLTSRHIHMQIPVPLSLRMWHCFSLFTNTTFVDLYEAFREHLTVMYPANIWVLLAIKSQRQRQQKVLGYVKRT